MSQSAVSRILFLVLRRDDDHSSSPVITDGIKQPTRKLWTGRPVTLPYLALLRAGFCLPSVLPRTRCALTAPFHPYPTAASKDAAFKCRRISQTRRPGGIFSVPLVLRVTPTGRYPAHCPAEFGLSSSAVALAGYGETRSSGALRPFYCLTNRHSALGTPSNRHSPIANRQSGNPAIDNLQSPIGNLTRRFPA